MWFRRRDGEWRVGDRNRDCGKGRRRRQQSHRGDESVAAPRQRFHEGRGFGRISERPPDLFHGGVQTVVEVHERVGWPEPLAQILASDDVARSIQQRRQYLRGLLLELHPAAVAVQLPARAVEHEPGELEPCLP